MVDIRVLSVILALALYGAFGSPTPQSFGVVEGAIGLLLLFAVHPGRVIRIFELRSPQRWPHFGLILLAYGMTIPLLCGVMRGNPPTLILRDMIPFLFLLLPLFLIHFDHRARGLIAMAVAGVGVLFSLRIVGLPLLHLNMPVSGGADPLYLSIAPTVLFAAVLLAGMGGYVLYRRCSLVSAIQAGVLLALSGLPLAAMAMTLQRASIGLFVVSIFVLLVIAVMRAPLRAFAPALVAGALALVFFPMWGDVAAMLVHKHALVGSNMRVQEAAAVFAAVDHSLLGALFGNGWGAQVESPAVGGLMVNFTHNLMTTYWLKAGVAGVVLLLVYLFTLARPLLAVIRANPVMVLALGAPLVIDCLFYASFKSLDFGLILLLIALWTRPQEAGDHAPAAVARPPGLVYP